MGASAAAVATTAQEYLRLSAESLDKVARFGAQTDGSGALRGYVRAEGGQFAGQLTFDPHGDLGAEQALAMQTAAVSMALRSAIANIQAAVERVEEKVSDIQRRIGAREIGEVVGTYRKLDRLVAATTARGHLLEADWDSIAGAGLNLKRALEAMRAYVSNTVGAIEANASLPKRESAIKRLGDPQRVAGTLRLILVAEQALHLWEYLRLERVRRTDPDHVESALSEARKSMKAQHTRDEELVAQTAEAIATVCTIGALEVHHFLAIPDSRKASNRALDQLEDVARPPAARPSPMCRGRSGGRTCRRPGTRPSVRRSRRRKASWTLPRPRVRRPHAGPRTHVLAEYDVPFLAEPQ